MNPDEFAARLRQLIGASSVNAFAEKSGVGEASIRSYLRGAVPGLDKAEALARAGGVSLDWLVGLSQAPAARQGTAQLLDDELMGRVTDAISRLYKEERIGLPSIDLGRLAARKYGEIVAATSDPAERYAMIKLVIIQLKSELRASAAQPGSGKASA